MFAPRLGGGKILLVAIIFLDVDDVAAAAAAVVPDEEDAEGAPGLVVGLVVGGANMRAKMRARSRRFMTMRSCSCVGFVVVVVVVVVAEDDVFATVTAVSCLILLLIEPHDMKCCCCSFACWAASSTNRLSYREACVYRNGTSPLPWRIYPDNIDDTSEDDETEEVDLNLDTNDDRSSEVSARWGGCRHDDVVHDEFELVFSSSPNCAVQSY